MYSQIRTEMEEKQKKRNRLHRRTEEVAYVDAQRNVAVSLGDKDIKTDVKAKNK